MQSNFFTYTVGNTTTSVNLDFVKGIIYTDGEDNAQLHLFDGDVVRIPAEVYKDLYNHIKSCNIL